MYYQIIRALTIVITYLLYIVLFKVVSTKQTKMILTKQKQINNYTNFLLNELRLIISTNEVNKPI